MILAGDIGGTNCRLAVFEEDARALVHQHVFKNKGRDRFEDVAREFLAQPAVAPHRDGIARACFGVAGAVRGGHVKMTNTGWALDERTLSQELGIARVALINDMVAHGENVDRLTPEQIVTIRAGEPCPDGNGAIIIAGTGLGEGGLYYDRCSGRHRGMASEGGHADFGPRDDREVALLRWLRDNGRLTTWEAVVSGPGLRAVYDFLSTTNTAGIDRRKAFDGEGPTPEQITASARAGDCPICAETVRVFVDLYGAEAGNLALKMCATAGVWLGGSIAEDLADHLSTPTFLDPFGAKGPDRIREMLAKVPVHLIKFELNGLYGAAVYATGL